MPRFISALIILAATFTHAQERTSVRVADLFTEPKLLDVSAAMFGVSKSVPERVQIDALILELRTFAKAVEVDLNKVNALLTEGKDTAAFFNAVEKWRAASLKDSVALKTKVPITVTLSEDGLLSLTAGQLAVARESGFFKIVLPTVKKE